jgi:hypothetical protein
MNEKLRGVGIAVIFGLALTGLTYFYASPIPLLGANDPFFWYYSVLSTNEASSATIATVHGFPFAYVLENEAVFIFGAFAFIMDFVIFLFLGSMIIWILFKRGNKNIRGLFGQKTVRKKVKK